MIKKSIVFFCFLLSNNSIVSRDWFEFAYQNAEYVLNFAKPHNETLFSSYKTQVYDLQDQINNLLKQSKVIGALDATTKKAIDALQQKQNTVLYKAANDLDSFDVTILQEIVTKNQTVISQLIDGWDYLYDFWEKNAIPLLKTEANADNTFKNNVASLVYGDQLLNDEKNIFLKNRQATLQEGWKKFFNQQPNNPIILGYVAPGGGYRAMMLTSGYLAALEELGLLDATSYLSGLSGSTWFLMPWLFSKGSIRSLQEAIGNKIQNKKLNIQKLPFDASGNISLDYLQALVEDLWPKFLFNQSISSVDVYGSLLSQAVLDKKTQAYYLPDLWNYVKDGKKPFPLFTSVTVYNDDKGKQKYSWNEFTPLEVRNLEYKLSMPSYSFGSLFEKGKSQEIAPLQSLGYLMGTFGSAYLFDLLDIKKIANALKNQAAQKMSLEATQYLIAATLVNLINVLPASINDTRVFPSLTWNPYKNSTYSKLPQSLKTSDQLMYVDAGISYNIPVLPLLRSSRNVNAIIIGDTSGDNPQQNEEPSELNKFFKDAQRLYGYTYQRVDDASTPTLRFYKDMKHPQAPRLIYINFIKDDQLLKKAQTNPTLKKLIDDNNLTSFDFNCINYTDGFCRFFNFDYTLAQFKQLSGIAEFNIRANAEKIKAFLLKK